ncbi:MAG: PAS domain-containing protein [Actinomycetota bacterium]
MPSVLTPTIAQSQLKILLVEDNADHADLIAEFLLEQQGKQQQFLTRVERLSQAIAAVIRETFDIILLDLSLPDSYGFDTVSQLREYSYNIPIVVLTSNRDEQLALQTIQAGAQDYLIKGEISSGSLIRSLHYAIERYRMKEALRQSEEQYRSVVNNLQSVIFQLDRQGNWTFLNPAWTELTGFSVIQSLGTPITDYIQTDDRPCYQAAVNALISGQQSQICLQLCLVTASGKCHKFQVYQHLTTTREGIATGFTGILVSLATPEAPLPAVVADYQATPLTIPAQTIIFENASNSQSFTGKIQRPEPLKSPHRFQKLADSLPALIYQFQLFPNGEIAFPYLSPGCRQLLELEPDTIPANTTQLFQQVHPDDRPALETSIAIATQTLQPWQQEWRQRMPSGTIKWLKGASQPEQQADGSTIWNGLVIDITPLKQTPHLSEARFFTLSLDLLCIAGKDGYFKRLNPSWFKTLGYTEAELLATPFLEFVHPLDRPATQAEVEKLFSGIPSVNFENRYRCKDGSYKWLAWTGTAFAEDGFAYCAARDITNRQQAEASLRESQHFIQQIAESSPNILYLYDLVEQRNIFVNRSIAQMLGYSQTEIQAMGAALLPTLTHPEDLARFPDYLNQVENGSDRECFEIEYRMQHKNGTWYWFSSREVIFARTPEGKPRQVLGTATDITEFKQTAQELIEKARQLTLRSEIGLALAQGGDLPSMLSLCVQTLVRHFKVAFARIWTLSSDRTSLELQASAGIYTHTNGAHARIPVGHLKIGLIATEKQPHLTNDVQNDPTVSDREWARREGMVGFAGYPLIVEDQVVGVMALFSRSPLNLKTLDCLALIASEIAVGIERKRAALALQLSEQRLQMAIAASGLGIWDWQLRTGQVYLSPELKTMLGYEPEKLENEFTIWERLVHPEDLPQVLALLTAHAHGEKTGEAVEFRMQSATGEWKWILSRSKVFEWDEGGKPLRVTGTHQDITERKLAESELLRFRLVVESTSDAVGMADLEGNHYYQNQAFTELYEYPTAAAFNEVGGPRIAFTQPEVAEEVLSTIMGGQPWVGEVEHISRSGRRMQVLLRANPIKDSDGNIIGLVSLNTDISDRQQAEAARLQLTRQLQEAQRVAQIGNWEFDIFVNQVTWSEELFRIYHREPGQIPSFEEILQQIHPEDQERWLAGVQRVMTEGGAYDIDHRVYLPHGEIRYINAKGQAMLDESGTVVRLFGTAMDITDRKQVEIALQQQFLREQLLGAIAQRMRQSLQLKEILNTTAAELQQALQADRVLVYQIFPNGTGCAIAEATATGYSSILNILFPEEIFPREIYEQYIQGRICAVSDRDLGGIVPCLVDFMAEMQVRAKLVVPIVQTGKLWGLLIAHQCSQPRVWQEGEIGLFQQLANQLAIGIQQSMLFEQAQTEIAERKATEMALRESERRERAKAIELEQAIGKLQSTQTQLVHSEKMAGLGQLVAGIAHEINNPVSFIFGNIAPATQYASDLLKLITLYQDRYPTPDPDIVEEIEAIELDFVKADFPKLLSSIQEGASRIKEIVLSLRNFSRLDEAEMKEADLHSGINSTLMLLQHRLKEQPDRKAIQVIQNFGKLPLVECHPGQLNQVFMNILCNAIDALEGKIKGEPAFIPTIWITTELETFILPGRPPVPAALIRIADNGPGISPQVQERIFNPFFTTKPVGAGTGLGLSISYQIIVEKHGGKLQCYSQLNQGAEFAIEVPLTPKFNGNS